MLCCKHTAGVLCSQSLSAPLRCGATSCLSCSVLPFGMPSLWHALGSTGLPSCCFVGSGVPSTAGWSQLLYISLSTHLECNTRSALLASGGCYSPQVGAIGAHAAVQTAAAAQQHMACVSMHASACHPLCSWNTMGEILCRVLRAPSGRSLGFMHLHISAAAGAAAACVVGVVSLPPAAVSEAFVWV